MARGTAGLTVLLASLSTLGPYTIDSFFPSLRAISADLNLTPLQAQQILTAFMVPNACMSLVHGSMSDALGRRRVVIAALALYILASLGSTFATSFIALLCCRALQGMVAGVGNTVGRAVVRDCYSGVQAQRVMSSITMIFALGPALAPVIGGWVHVWFGWHAVFGTMALFGALLLIATIIWLPETHPPEKRTELHLGVLTGNVMRVLTHRRFQAMTSSSVLCFIALLAYVGAAPAIVLDHWHLSETHFGMLFIPIVLGYSTGAWLSGRAAGRIEPERMLRWGYHGCLLVNLAMLLLQWGLPHAPLILQQLLLFSLAVSVQIIFPVVTLRVLDLFPHSRGAASSAQAFYSMIMSALMMGLVAPWISITMPRMALCCFALTAAGWLLWRAQLRHPHSGSAQHD